ncbi:PadR family transcriptional regulator [Actinomyces israelii]|uniref:PadR family transcriptional regulator n=1 Tax=Actinomyces israelii TaxID=1659 RepID=UPI002357E251|nr:PadR family transcriptional regulator [Actinomyces israelii]
MLALKILGFLDDGPLHGYELRRRIVELGGPGSHLSDGALYPALARLEAAGYLVRTARPGRRGRARRRIEITTAGREHLHARLRHPDETEMTSTPRFLTVLAFLSRLPAAADREAVLRRRLAILQAPAPAFFYDDGAPRRSAREPDPYRRGMARVAGAARRAEIEWLHEMLDEEHDEHEEHEEHEEH